MKKIITAICLLVSVAAFAQLTPKKVAKPITTLASVANVTGEEYSVIRIDIADSLGLYFFRVPTQNRYDDAMLFPLGTKPNEVLTSLDNLLQMIGYEAGSSYELPMDVGVARVKVNTNKAALFPTNKNALYFFADDRAGGQIVTEGELKKLIKRTKKFYGNKTATH